MTEFAFFHQVAVELKKRITAGEIVPDDRIQAFVDRYWHSPLCVALDRGAVGKATRDAAAKLARTRVAVEQARAERQRLFSQGRALTGALAAQVSAALADLGSIQHSVVAHGHADEPLNHSVTVANLAGIPGVQLTAVLEFFEGHFSHWTIKGTRVTPTQIVLKVIDDYVANSEQVLAGQQRA
jgi:hypothetical protein